MSEQLAFLPAENGNPQRGAILSSCERYRYTLWRSWGDGPRVLFVMLNPSTADATADDPTIRRCVSFARRWNHDSVEVVNLFAFRATKPSSLVAAWKSRVDVIGPENQAYLDGACIRANRIVAAWGASDLDEVLRGDAIRAARRRLERHTPIWCLGRTKAGHPRHPLYVPGDVTTEAFIP